MQHGQKGKTVREHWEWRVASGFDDIPIGDKLGIIGEPTFKDWRAAHEPRFHHGHDMSKIVKFPTKGWERASNRRGKRSVSCIVTDRFLRFEESTAPTDEGTAIVINVMTDASGEERKLTTLVLTLEQLRAVLKQYE